MVFGIAVLERITWYVAHTTCHLDAYTGDPSFAVRVKAAFGARKRGRNEREESGEKTVPCTPTIYTPTITPESSDYEGSELLDSPFDWHQFLGRESED